MGRRAKPAEIRRAQGNPGKRPIAALEVEPAEISGAPRPVHDLGAEAKAVWDRLAPELARVKFLRETDVGAFERYCVALTEWWCLTGAIARDGFSVEVQLGHGHAIRRINPDVQARTRIARELTDLEDRFGLSARARYELASRMNAAAAQGALFGLPSLAAAAAESAARSSPIGILALH
jgi:P27 family predicted phage terminase small subunit